MLKHLSIKTGHILVVMQHIHENVKRITIVLFFNSWRVGGAGRVGVARKFTSLLGTGEVLGVLFCFLFDCYFRMEINS